MKIKIMKKGDEILNVTSEFVVVKRRNGEVDIIPLTCDETGIRIDTDKIVTIGYGNNVVKEQTEEGVTIISF